MNLNKSDLWQELKKLNYVTGDMPDSLDTKSPWYVRLMTGLAAWTGSLFMLGFMALLFESTLDDGATITAFGCVMMFASYFILKTKNKNEFINQLSLVFSFAGQLLFIIGIIEIEGNLSSNIWLYIFILQATLTWFMPSYIHRVSSSFFSAIALSMAISHYNIVFLQSAILISITSYIWLNEFNWIEKHNTLSPVAYGLTLALIFQEAITVFFHDFNMLISNWRSINETLLPPWMGELMIGLTLLFVVWSLLKRQHIKIPGRSSIAAFIAAILLIFISLQAAGITVGIVIILLGYANGNKILSGLGFTASLFYISSYYYMLDNTLSEKALLLATLGVFLLIGRLVMKYLFSPQINTQSK